MPNCCTNLISKLDSLSTAKVQVGDHSYGKFSLKKLLAFMGPGFLISIGYIDPGNFDTDISAGSEYQYKLIWILFLASMMGMVVQFLAAKLGLATSIDLAQHCRRVYPKWLTITLWIMAEIAIIASDVPEVLGTAFALLLLFGIPLWIGVIITAVDTMLFLFLQYISVRILEAIIGLFMLVISMCFIVEMFWAKPNYLDMLLGFVPFYGINTGQGPVSGYISSGISLMGAVVMPHNLFLHSALVQSREVPRTKPGISEAMIYNLIECVIALGISFFINVSIISVSASTFYYNPDAGLNDASQLLQLLGAAAPYVFGVALLASGQSSTITGTYAGQFVMEGFLEIKIAAWKRNIITRSVAIVPSLIVAIIAGPTGSDSLIVWSQVLLSIQLPFALLPLLNLTSSDKVMNQFRNSWQLISLGWLISIFVITANLTLVAFSIIPYVGFSTWWQICLFVLLVLVGLLYLAFLVYLGRVDVEKRLRDEDCCRDFDSGIERHKSFDHDEYDEDDDHYAINDDTPLFTKSTSELPYILKN